LILLPLTQGDHIVVQRPGVLCGGALDFTDKTYTGLAFSWLNKPEAVLGTDGTAQQETLSPISPIPVATPLYQPGFVKQLVYLESSSTMVAIGPFEIVNKTSSISIATIKHNNGAIKYSSVPGFGVGIEWDIEEQSASEFDLQAWDANTILIISDQPEFLVTPRQDAQQQKRTQEFHLSKREFAQAQATASPRRGSQSPRAPPSSSPRPPPSSSPRPPPSSSPRTQRSPSPETSLAEGEEGEEGEYEEYEEEEYEEYEEYDEYAEEGEEEGEGEETEGEEGEEGEEEDEEEEEEEEEEDEAEEEEEEEAEEEFDGNLSPIVLYNILNGIATKIDFPTTSKAPRGLYIAADATHGRIFLTSDEDGYGNLWMYSNNNWTVVHEFTAPNGVTRDVVHLFVDEISTQGRVFVGFEQINRNQETSYSFILFDPVHSTTETPLSDLPTTAGDIIEVVSHKGGLVVLCLDSSKRPFKSSIYTLDFSDRRPDWNTLFVPENLNFSVPVKPVISSDGDMLVIVHHGMIHIWEKHVYKLTLPLQGYTLPFDESALSITRGFGGTTSFNNRYYLWIVQGKFIWVIDLSDNDHSRDQLLIGEALENRPTVTGLVNINQSTVAVAGDFIKSSDVDNLDGLALLTLDPNRYWDDDYSVAGKTTWIPLPPHPTLPYRNVDQLLGSNSFLFVVYAVTEKQLKEQEASINAGSPPFAIFDIANNKWRDFTMIGSEIQIWPGGSLDRSKIYLTGDIRTVTDNGTPTSGDDFLSFDTNDQLWSNKNLPKPTDFVKAGSAETYEISFVGEILSQSGDAELLIQYRIYDRNDAVTLRIRRWSTQKKKWINFHLFPDDTPQDPLEIQAIVSAGEARFYIGLHSSQKTVLAKCDFTDAKDCNWTIFATSQKPGQIEDLIYFDGRLYVLGTFGSYTRTLPAQPVVVYEEATKTWVALEGSEKLRNSTEVISCIPFSNKVASPDINHDSNNLYYLFFLFGIVLIAVVIIVAIIVFIRYRRNRQSSSDSSSPTQFNEQDDL